MSRYIYVNDRQWRMTKKNSERSIPQTAARARRVETSEEEKEEERACGISLLTHLPSGATPHLIC
jgi:hypothetical protein